MQELEKIKWCIYPYPCMNWINMHGYARMTREQGECKPWAFKMHEMRRVQGMTQLGRVILAIGNKL